jgi:dTDP-4-amino-4,6-dideoxygalactose transaminase
VTHGVSAVPARSEIARAQSLDGAEQLEHVPFYDLAGMTREVQDEILAEWTGLLKSGQFIGGPAVARFEEEWAEFCGARFAVGVANGTDALHLTLRALGIGPGDEVVVPANTFVATVEAVVLAGATPRFADVDPDTLLITSQTLAEAAGPATRAVIVVDLYGQMPDMDALQATTADLGIDLIEDAAQSQGATWGSGRSGSYGVAGCFSFYPGKNLGAFGDAGAVVTSDERLADRLMSLRDHGRARGGHYDHELLGLNSRLDALQAAVLSAKIPRLDEWNASRRGLMALYRRLLEPSAARLVEQLPGGNGVYHLAVVRVPDRDRIRAALSKAAIGTGIHYPTPCHLMAPYADFSLRQLPVAEKQAAEILSLPLHPYMQPEDVERVCAVVSEIAPRTE